MRNTKIFLYSNVFILIYLVKIGGEIMSKLPRNSLKSCRKKHLIKLEVK